MSHLKRTALTVFMLFGVWVFPAWSSPIVDSDGRTPSLAPLMRDVTPAVVNIAVRGVSKTQNPLYDDPAFRWFFDSPELTREFQAAGSGVIVDASKGYILTNRHVVEIVFITKWPNG